MLIAILIIFLFIVYMLISVNISVERRLDEAGIDRDFERICINAHKEKIKAKKNKKESL